MVDYACARTLNYIDGLGDGARFTTTGVNDDFFNGTTAEFPIPFNDVMIGTFMLEALRGAFDVHDALARLKLDWPRAMVLVSSRAGSNVSSGLTEGTNWLPLFLKAASGFTLPDDRIKIVPYAEVRPSLGQAQLAPADLTYYVQRVWGPLFYRKLVSDQVFASIPTIYLPDRPPLPGDYDVTKAGAIDQFMVEVAAVQGRTNANLAAGYGFTGILVAFLARHNPLAVIPVAVLLGGISASGGLLQRRLGLPDASVLVLQGIIFVFVLASDALYGRIGFLKGKS